jgi:carboxylate-amine ligase
VGIRKIGAEEELLLVDPDTNLLTAVAEQAVRAHDGDGRPMAVDEPEVERELFRQQIETMTEPCTTLDELEERLCAGRRAVAEAAAEAGAVAVAVATPVLVDEDAEITPQPRYERIREEYGDLARTALVSAMHLHIDIDDEDEGVRVLDGIRPWLPVLLAVSANSPFCRGRDTGHASWRSQIWTRWPSHGSAEAFGSAETYHDVRRTLTDWGAALDDGMIYFDARLSQAYPTVEIRVADVCTDVEDAVLVAGLCRGLVATLAANGDGEAWRSELLRASMWRAARYGMADQLVHPQQRRLAPAREVLESLVALVRPALDEAGDRDRVDDLVERLLARGTGATRQRRAFERDGRLEDVVTDLVARTAESAADPQGRTS